MKKQFKMAYRILIGFILLAILICIGCTGFGYMQYQSYIQKKYNDTAYQVAAVFRDFFDPEELNGYIHMAMDYKAGELEREALDAAAAGEEYQAVLRQLVRLRENMEVNDIYLAYLDVDELYNFDGNTENWSPMTYIFDSYIVPELVFTFGDMGGLNPEFLEDAIRVAETGERSDNYFISESEFGYNTSAILPVTEDGKAIAVVGVEVPMLTLQSALNEYVARSVVSIAIITAVCITIYVQYLYRKMVMPINLIAREASNFVKEENKISENLDKVKTGDEIQLLSEAVLQMEVDINQYIDNLTKATAEKERIGAELNIATQIQADMLPNIFPAFPDYREFDIYASMQPAKEVGGDFYDFFMVDKEHLAVVMADVSGKGVPAALFMVIAKTLIKNHAQGGEEPRTVFTNVNNQLCENNEIGMFVTGWIGIMDIHTGHMVYANAGHNPPLIVRKDGSVEWIKSRPGLVLAGMEGIRYRQNELQLYEGDTLYLYTDGVTEALDNSLELFGDARLEQALSEEGVRIMDTKEVIAHVTKKLTAFADGAEQADDITMLALTVKTFDTSSEGWMVWSGPARDESLDDVLAFLAAPMEEAGFSMAMATQMDVAVEEIFVNIAHYAYGEEGGSATVKYRLDRSEKTLSIRFEDSGIPYNPLEKEDPDVTLSAEDRGIGGLGIYIVKKSMDEVHYEYRDNKNCFTMVKKYG